MGKKQYDKNSISTQGLINIKTITDYSLITEYGELVYFIIKPTNISVLSESSISNRIYALMTVLKGITDVEMICLNSKENFDDNKIYLKKRMEEESNPIIQRLLQIDSQNLDHLQVQTATSREFLIIIRLQNQKETENLPYLSRIEKILKEQGFTTKRADNDDIKKIIAVYFEQNVTTDSYEDFDGERWVILGE